MYDASFTICARQPWTSWGCWRQCMSGEGVGKGDQFRSPLGGGDARQPRDGEHIPLGHPALDDVGESPGA